MLAPFSIAGRDRAYDRGLSITPYNLCQSLLTDSVNHRNNKHIGYEYCHIRMMAAKGAYIVLSFSNLVFGSKVRFDDDYSIEGSSCRGLLSQKDCCSMSRLCTCSLAIGASIPTWTKDRDCPGGQACGYGGQGDDCYDTE